MADGYLDKIELLDELLKVGEIKASYYYEQVEKLMLARREHKANNK
ncbi:hypothetical protein [Niallia taxi]|nr:hypothetical protein [Niallia taxi]